MPDPEEMPMGPRCPRCGRECRHVEQEWRGYMLVPPACPICANEAVTKRMAEEGIRPY